MIHDYLEYPSKSQWIEIVSETRISELYLEVSETKEGDIISSLFNQEFKSWLRLFNNRLGQSRMSYVFLMHYYKKGIPDDEWFLSPGKEGQSVQYFPHFNEENFYYKMMFDYYMDIFYYKFFSAWDTMFHVINVYYSFDLLPNSRFNSNVMQRLLQRNNSLHTIISNVSNSEPFVQSRTLRNNITHNYAPNDISSGITIEKIKEGVSKISFGIGTYTTSKTFIENVNGIIDKFIPLLAALKNAFESDS
ncbi:Cthe_2314 family HEPN domain-containing protein [Parageobacillus thermoglucosidasius]|uniref:Cthe_2314 family HEPN domain-containing protein n=1 Tax=Parageobacillus thermoglucosidasius TaxID=1426 RepID=UPI000B55A9AB|nr:Cthe_2314 family HEPN domain-containing protein [Parageobacillus thermoglucosidasius]OUM83850.1 MAG: hypothetical protein BAA00_10760 [Parageobacillus thermoglucosidasius]